LIFSTVLDVMLMLFCEVLDGSGQSFGDGGGGILDRRSSISGGLSGRENLTPRLGEDL